MKASRLDWIVLGFLGFVLSSCVADFVRVLLSESNLALSLDLLVLGHCNNSASFLRLP